MNEKRTLWTDGVRLAEEVRRVGSTVMLLHNGKELPVSANSQKQIGGVAYWHPCVPGEAEAVIERNRREVREREIEELRRMEELGLAMGKIMEGTIEMVDEHLGIRKLSLDSPRFGHTVIVFTTETREGVYGQATWYDVSAHLFYKRGTDLRWSHGSTTGSGASVDAALASVVAAWLM